MSATTTPARFMANNFLQEMSLYTVTSEASGYAKENLYGSLRSVPWRAAGNFTITASNGTFYFNDGSARTAVVPPGNYTATTLATAIAAAAVTAGASATVVASAYSTAPYVWQLVFSTSVTLTLSSTSNAIWDVLGFTGSTARTGRTFRADAARAHTHEQITMYFGAPMTPTFIGAIGELGAVVPASESAVWTLMLNNINEWTAPPVTVTLDRTDQGYFQFLDSLTSTTYEYAALKIVDRENVLGTAGVEIGYLYLGDYTTLTSSNVAIGWSKTFVDPSVIQVSRNGTRYANRLPRFRRFTGMAIRLIEASERRELEQTLFDVGLDQSFFISIDPSLSISETLDEMTMYGHLATDPMATHAIRDRFAITLEVEESV